RTKTLDRGINHPRVKLLDAFPGEAHAVEHARREVLHQHVAGLDQALQHLLALGMLRIERDGTLVMIEHRKIEAVRIRDIPKLAAGDIADARPLDLDDVGTEPSEKLRAGRTRLHVREIENTDAFQGFHFKLPISFSARFAD